MWNAPQEVPYAYKGNQWIGYGNPKSFALKVRPSAPFLLPVWRRQGPCPPGAFELPSQETVRGGRQGSRRASGPAAEPSSWSSPSAPVHLRLAAVLHSAPAHSHPPTPGDSFWFPPCPALSDPVLQGRHSSQLQGTVSTGVLPLLCSSPAYGKSIQTQANPYRHNQNQEAGDHLGC